MINRVSAAETPSPTVSDALFALLSARRIGCCFKRQLSFVPEKQSDFGLRVVGVRGVPGLHLENREDKHGTFDFGGLFVHDGVCNVSSRLFLSLLFLGEALSLALPVADMATMYERSLKSC